MRVFFKLIKNLIFFAIIACALYFAYEFFQENNFMDYTKNISKKDITEFKRDNQIKYSDKRSFKISSPEFNDAMITKKVTLKKNKPYRVSCMVKTENVESENDKSGSGAHISIDGQTIRSIAVKGTTDWQKIELIFNSKNKEELAIGVRLGGYEGECKGTAWFSDIKIEQGAADESNEWKFACFMYNNTDVNINNENVKIQVSAAEVSDIRNTIRRFEDVCETLSQGKMKAKCDFYNIDTPLSKLSYDEEFGYYVGPEDVENDIKNTINQNNYDHIFIIVKLGNDKFMNTIQINDWIGLGSMDYYGIGFSNIRLPNDSKSYVYKYDSRINEFPEEVFLHEFLHSLERNSKEYGYEIPQLHDYQQYGYKEEALIGQKKWYTDYMNCEINSGDSKIGLPKEIYTLKPAKNSDFEYASELKNIFD